MTQVRTTVILTANVKANLDCLSKIEGLTQTAIIQQALRDYMRRKGLKPDSAPKLTIRYGGEA